MVRTLLVDHVRYADVPLPWSATVLVTVRSDEGERAGWDATVDLPGPLDLPESGSFTGDAETGPVAGEATLTRAETTTDQRGVHTALFWQGTGRLSLPR